jgi:hypothetical protein
MFQFVLCISYAILRVHFCRTDSRFCFTETISEKESYQMKLVSRAYQHSLFKKAYQHYARCSLIVECMVLWCLHLLLSLD